MERSSSNKDIINNLINICDFSSETNKTKWEIQDNINKILQKAQEKCLSQLVELRAKGNIKALSKEKLKQHTRNLMVQEIERMIYNGEFGKASTSTMTKKTQQSPIQAASSSNQNTDNLSIVGTVHTNIEKSKQTPKNKENGKDIKIIKIVPKKRDSSKSPGRPSNTCFAPAKKDSNCSQSVAKTKKSSTLSVTVEARNKTAANSSSNHSSLKNRTLPPSNLSLHSNYSTTITRSLRPIQLQRLQRIQEFVEAAIRNRKTFTIYGYSLVRRFLYNRGWVEKLNTSSQSLEVQQQAERMNIPQLVYSLDDPNYGYVYVRMLKSKLLRNNICDMVWEPRPLIYSLIKNAHKPVWLNHFRKRGEYDFATKMGLCLHMRNLKWNYRPGLSDVYFPRTYILSNNEMDDFVYDFRVTACLGLLQWFVERAKNHQKEPVLSNKGTVSADVFYFAILQCIGYIKYSKDMETKLSYSQQTWTTFMDNYYKCVYCNENFISSENDSVKEMVNQATNVLNRVRHFRKELDSEGINNVWILKPDHSSRGHGIHVCRKLNQIKEVVTKNSHIKYVIQKYLERPLLIYNTKFDIRQWFLISCSNPLTVWMYTESYLRFSSQQYNVKRFHESIHLTNNSVQCRYKNAQRDRRLPEDNMWDSNTFSGYLEKNGHPNVWKNIIYPKIKEAVMTVLLSAREEMEQRPYTFELYGADLMLTPDFQPWLIEINSHPALSPSTSVTARLCPQVIEDVIRVIVDRSRITNASTGKFELIYRDKIHKLPSTAEENFFVQGTPLPLHYYQCLHENLVGSLQEATPSEVSLKIPKQVNRIKDKPIAMVTDKKKINHEELVTVESSIETTRKIVHMKSILHSLLNLLNFERMKRENEVLLNMDSKSSLLNITEVTSAVHDLRKTISTLSKSEASSATQKAKLRRCAENLLAVSELRKQVQCTQSSTAVPDLINLEVKSAMFNVPYEGIEADIKFVGKILARLNRSKMKNHGRLMTKVSSKKMEQKSPRKTPNKSSRVDLSLWTKPEQSISESINPLVYEDITDAKLVDGQSVTQIESSNHIRGTPTCSNDDLNVWRLEPGKSICEIVNPLVYDEITEAEKEEHRQLMSDESLTQVQSTNQIGDDHSETIVTLKAFKKSIVETIEIQWPRSLSLNRNNLDYLKILSKTLPFDTWHFVKCYVLYILEQNKAYENHVIERIHYPDLMDHICTTLIPASVPEKLGYLLSLYHKSKFTPSTVLILQIISVISKLWSQQSQQETQELESDQKEYSAKLLETCSSVSFFLTVKYLMSIEDKQEITDKQITEQTVNIDRSICPPTDSKNDLQSNDSGNERHPEIFIKTPSPEKNVETWKRPKTSAEETETNDKLTMFRTQSDSSIYHRVSNTNSNQSTEDDLNNSTISLPQSPTTQRLANRLDKFSRLLRSYKKIVVAMNKKRRKTKLKRKEHARTVATNSDAKLSESECFENIDSFDCFQKRDESQISRQVTNPVFKEISSILNNKNIVLLKKFTQQVEKIEINVSRSSYRKSYKRKRKDSYVEARVESKLEPNKILSSQRDANRKIMSPNDDSLYVNAVKSKRLPREASSQKEACSLFVSMLPDSDIRSKSFFEIKLVPSTPNSLSNTPSRISGMTNSQNSVTMGVNEIPKFKNKQKRLHSSKILPTDTYPNETFDDSKLSINLDDEESRDVSKFSRDIQKKINVISGTLLKLYYLINSECEIMEMDLE